MHVLKRSAAKPLTPQANSGNSPSKAKKTKPRTDDTCPKAVTKTELKTPSFNEGKPKPKEWE